MIVRGAASLAVLVLLWAGTADAQRANGYDRVVDVTGMTGPKACAAMQGALNSALAPDEPKAHILFRGQLGSPDRPVDFTMFQNKGAQGFSGKPWPYSVCHAFWPIHNAREGEGVVDGYPDPLFPRIVRSGRTEPSGEAATVRFREPICKDFSFDRKQAFIASGRGAGQMRFISSCRTERVAEVQPAWDVPPDGSSVVEVIDWRNYWFGQVDLYVTYDLDVYYENNTAQKVGQHGIFADVGMHCYFVGAPRASRNPHGCPAQIHDGIHRTGRITIHEKGRRDDGLDCRPTWLAEDGLTNRPFSVVWQALGPGVVRGTNTVAIDIVGEGDRDNVGVIALNNWTKDFRRWRVKRIGTGVWISGSLNNTLYDPYLTGNEFGLVVGANERWGAGMPRWQECQTGVCASWAKDSTTMNVRGGVIEGNRCGNFVMFGGYGGEVDRTFIETGAKGSPTYLGHSVLVGAGVCDSDRAPSPRQGMDRALMVCGDDLDCGGVCDVNAEARRAYTFQWDASLVYNREDPRWFAFMLGKGTRREHLVYDKAEHNNIRVSGAGFGGEMFGGKRDFYFYPSAGAAVAIDADAASGLSMNFVLPAYDHYVSMPSRDLEAVIRAPADGRYLLGRLQRRATCTEGAFMLVGGRLPSAHWTVKHGRSLAERGTELIAGGRSVAGSNAESIFGVSDLAEPYVPEGSAVWLEVENLRGQPDELGFSMRCWEDK